MGKQTFVVLQCCTCHMFQAQIDKASRSFNCNICHLKQAYSRVFAKSNLAKDLRPLVAEYNARSVAEVEATNAAEAEEPWCSLTPTDPDRDREADELEAQQMRADAIGDVWNEFADDSGCQRSGDREACGGRGDEEDSAEGRGWGFSNPSGRTVGYSNWERDSDARRMEEQRVRFVKRPRQKRRADVSRRALAGRAGERRSNGDGSGDTADGCNTLDDLNEPDERNKRNKQGVDVCGRETSPVRDTAWGAFLSDDER